MQGFSTPERASYRRSTPSVRNSESSSRNQQSSLSPPNCPCSAVGSTAALQSRERSIARLAAKGMRWVNAQNAHFAGKELELLQRPRERRILGMPVDIGEELSRGEFAALHVALELGHIDAVGGEA